MPNYVNYSIELCDENAALIDKINALTTPGYKSPGTNTSTTKGDKGTLGGEITLAKFKVAVKAAKDEHGEEFCLDTIEKLTGVDAPPSLGRRLSAIAAEDYAKVIAALEKGPSDDLDDDDLDDDDDDLDDDDLDDPEVDPDAVKTAIRAYAKKNGKEKAQALMKKGGVANLAACDDADPSTLAKLLKLAS